MTVEDGDDRFFYSASRDMSLWYRPKMKRVSTVPSDQGRALATSVTLDSGAVSRDSLRPLMRRPESAASGPSSPRISLHSTIDTTKSMPTSPLLGAPSVDVEGRLPSKKKISLKRGLSSACASPPMTTQYLSKGNALVTMNDGPLYLHAPFRRAETVPISKPTRPKNSIDAVIEERDRLQSELRQLRSQLAQEIRQRHVLEKQQPPVSPPYVQAQHATLPRGGDDRVDDHAATSKTTYTFAGLARARRADSMASMSVASPLVRGGSAFDSPAGSAVPQRRFSSLPGLNFSTLSFLKSVPLLQSFSENQFLRLSTSLRLVRFGPGEVIYRQGDPGSNFYIIDIGLVRVHFVDSELGTGDARPAGAIVVQSPLATAAGIISSTTSITSQRDGNGAIGRSRIDVHWSALQRESDIEPTLGPVVAELTRGLFFGERALLTAEPRSSSCVAGDAEVVCYELTRAAFEEVRNTDMFNNGTRQLSLSLSAVT